MRSLKIWAVLLLSLGLVVATGEGTLVAAADSHATHFVSDIGPDLDQDEGGCTTCHAAGSLQCDPDGPLFADDKDKDETAVCDKCHSQGGVYDGVNDPVFGAKANWAEGVYEPDGTLKDGKDKWCAGCHDDDPASSEADGSGIIAPNVIGDSSQVYGYYVESSGHGRPSADVKCEACHDLTHGHIDDDQRTFDVNETLYPTEAYEGHSYNEGYRLKAGLEVPRVDEDDFPLCQQCHPGVFGTSSNFRYDRSPAPNYLHAEHTNFGHVQSYWDSDWDGATVPWNPTLKGDSRVSCPTCHNVHGSPMCVAAEGSYYGNCTAYEANPVMIRHGELTGSTPLDFRWYTEGYGFQGTGGMTSDREDSRSGQMWVIPPSCTFSCHMTLPYYNRTPGTPLPDVVIDDFEAYTNDAGLQAVWDNSKDAKAPRLEPQSTGATGPDGSQCMRVRIKWTRTTYDYGVLIREYAPYVDATGMGFFSFYVKLNNNAKIERIQVRLKKYGSTVCVANFYTSELENGVWKLVSIPRASFSDTTWGQLSKITFRIYEYNPSSSYTHDVYFDNIRFTQ